MKKKTDVDIFTSKKDIAILTKYGKKAVKEAIRINRILGLSFSFTKGNKVFRVQENGEVVFVKQIAERKSLNIKKGAILYVKSK